MALSFGKNGSSPDTYMERRLLPLIILFFSAFSVFSQAPSQIDQLRIQVWADLDPFPGVFSESESETAGTETEAAKESESAASKEQSLKE